MNKVSLGYFLLGISVGGLVSTAVDAFLSYRHMKKIYARCDAEILDMKAYYERKYNNSIAEVEQEVTENLTKIKDEQEQRYRDLASAYTPDEGGEGKELTGNKKEVIPPDEFGMVPDYETVSLNYFEDGVLTDDQYNIVENPDAMIGSDALDSFGEWEDDAVYVVDHDSMCYYEILKDSRDFADVFQYEVPTDD